MIMNSLKNLIGCNGYCILLVAIPLVIAIFICGCESVRWRHHEERMTMTTTTEEPIATTQTTITTTTITTKKTTTATTTTTTEETTTTTTTTDMKDSLTYLGSFTGTYFKGKTNPCNGGSGRILIPCDIKDDTYKGSVASKLIFNSYGYELNGKTMIYIEFPSIPALNGWYSVDDCNADPSIIDFYFPDYSKCPWENDGVIQCVAWIS